MIKRIRHKWLKRFYESGDIMKAAIQGESTRSMRHGCVFF